MKPTHYNYFTLQLVHAANCFQFTGPDAFYHFIQAHQLKDVLVLTGDAGEISSFAVLHNNALFRTPTLGFNTLEDYHTSVQQHFPDAAVFYEATAAGYKVFEDYQLVKEAGIADRDIFEKIKASGFKEGFKDYNVLQQGGNAMLPEINEPSNAFELYTFATTNGFENYTGFKEAFLKGFTNAQTYAIAKDQGFPSYADYKEALEKGLRGFKELEFARSKKVRDRQDFNRMIDLEFLECDTCTHDEKVLLVLLSKLEQGKRVSINKLKSLFIKMVEDYRYADTAEMPLWYTFSLQEETAITAFLLKNEQVKKYGHYDADGEFFEINRMQDRKVVIDGSNVAHNSNGNGASKPSVSNILSVIELLKSKGFTEIIVINDASLKHKLTDADKIPQLKEAAEYIEAPRENPADPFIIQYVKRHHCLLVSNDTFREWKVQDPWIAENIDFYRLAFMIKGEEVLMPDLK